MTRSSTRKLELHKESLIKGDSMQEKKKNELDEGKNTFQMLMKQLKKSQDEIITLK